MIQVVIFLFFFYHFRFILVNASVIDFFGVFFVGVSETSLDGENSVKRRSGKKPMPESGAREHKEQLQKLSEKVGFVLCCFLRTFYKYLICGLTLSVFILRFEISIWIKVSRHIGSSYLKCFPWFISMSFVALYSLSRISMSVIEVYVPYLDGMGWNGKEDRDRKMFTSVELEIVFDVVIWLHYTGNIIHSFSISGPRILRVLERA